MRTPQRHPDRSGINRFGENHIQADRYQDLDPAIEWSSDPRSEASHEKHFRGKGPLNFSRSDSELLEEVCEVFMMNPDLDPENIEVEVKDSIVTLKGRVRVREDRNLAEDLARDIPGVNEVVNLISRGKWDLGDDPGGLIKGLR